MPIFPKLQGGTQVAKVGFHAPQAPSATPLAQAEIGGEGAHTAEALQRAGVAIGETANVLAQVAERARIRKNKGLFAGAMNDIKEFGLGEETKSFALKRGDATDIVAGHNARIEDRISSVLESLPQDVRQDVKLAAESFRIGSTHRIAEHQESEWLAFSKGEAEKNRMLSLRAAGAAGRAGDLGGIIAQADGYAATANGLDDPAKILINRSGILYEGLKAWAIKDPKGALVAADKKRDELSANQLSNLNAEAKRADRDNERRINETGTLLSAGLDDKIEHYIDTGEGIEGIETAFDGMDALGGKWAKAAADGRKQLVLVQKAKNVVADNEWETFGEQYKAVDEHLMPKGVEGYKAEKAIYNSTKKLLSSRRAAFEKDRAAFVMPEVSERMKEPGMTMEDNVAEATRLSITLQRQLDPGGPVAVLTDKAVSNFNATFKQAKPSDQIFMVQNVFKSYKEFGPQALKELGVSYDYSWAALSMLKFNADESATVMSGPRNAYVASTEEQRTLVKNALDVLEGASGPLAVMRDRGVLTSNGQNDEMAADLKELVRRLTLHFNSDTKAVKAVFGDYTFESGDVFVGWFPKRYPAQEMVNSLAGIRRGVKGRIGTVAKKTLGEKSVQYVDYVGSEGIWTMDSGDSNTLVLIHEATGMAYNDENGNRITTTLPEVYGFTPSGQLKPPDVEVEQVTARPQNYEVITGGYLLPYGD